MQPQRHHPGRAPSRPASTAAAPAVVGATDPRLDVEAIGQALHRLGARVRFQATPSHRHIAGPITWACTLASAVSLLGLMRPLPAIALLLAMLLAAVRDADGGASWVRRLLPRSAGWTVCAELGADAQAPTLVVWAPVTARVPSLSTTSARLLLAGPALAVPLAAMGLALAPSLAPTVGPGMVLVAMGILLLTGPAAAVIQRFARPMKKQADPARWIVPLARHLLGPDGDATLFEKHRIVFMVGSGGGAWNDDLAVTLANMPQPLDPACTVLLAVEAGPGPLSVVAREGLAIVQAAPDDLVAALSSAGLPTSSGRTGAVRATRVGLRAVGIQGTADEAGHGPRSLEAALRCLLPLTSSKAAP